MGGSFRVARLFGIPVELNVSWFLILFLVVWSLAAELLPRWAPGHSVGAYWAWGTVTALALFAGLVAHEFSHALVSRRFGVEVRRITLFLFGGVSEAPGEMPSPKAEFWIAIAGPLMSFAIALLAWGAAVCAQALDAPPGVSSVLGWLALINGALGAFNLLPGFPLDGGRVLRAALWARGHDLKRATRQASYAGQGLAAILGGIGVARLFSGNWFGGFWLIFLAMLLYQAAQGSYQSLVLTNELDATSVGAVMGAPAVTLGANESIAEVVDRHFLHEGYGGYPVVDEAGRCLGLLTRRQVQALPREAWATTRVAAAMAPAAALPLLAPDEPLGSAFTRLDAAGFGRLPVVAEGRVVGVLSATDVVRYLTWRGQAGGEA